MDDISRNGVGYQRQRLVAAKFGTLDAVVAHMRAEMAAGKPISPANFEYNNDAILVLHSTTTPSPASALALATWWR